MDADGFVVLVTFQSGFPHEIDGIAFLEVIRGSSFDPEALLLSDFQSPDVDLVWIEPASVDIHICFP